MKIVGFYLLVTHKLPIFEAQTKRKDYEIFGSQRLLERH